MLAILAFIGVVACRLICVDSNPLNCYPELFVPSLDWKPVKEGQVIPAGLDIRLNIDTLEREAKLSSDDSFSQENSIVVMADAAEDTVSESLRYIAGFVENGAGESNVLVDKLEFLSEMSSDLEYGADIMGYLQDILILSGLYDQRSVGVISSEVLSQVSELSTSILSSSLRNNPQAQETFVRYFLEPKDFILRLLGSNVNEVLVRRRLGILGSLVTNNIFTDHFDVIRLKLLILYGHVGDDSTKERILHIITDVLGQEEDEVLDRQFAVLAQATLCEQSQLTADVLDLLGQLEKVKLVDKSLFKATPEFLDWLNTQIETLREQKAPQLERFKELRHVVFGNPKAMRKSYDEL
ncbi:hypothetical protein OGAPHI_000467 [Ogataea philodendri]|uniref:Nucleotide exchange factor SIL1 n=1 Tax=Ogataea philodendri TaxID=1378263 RepID=A0A9P8PH14_9ASCO|nr:uncharacterized protein OGAPHI_000467 [Ogataea philodendri]KAH3671244.1 hypothetical protein OGAPHI_000467 [Ogataea philodendri]